MEQTSKRGQGSAGGDARDGDTASVIPTWQQLTMLLYRIDRLLGAAQTAQEGGDLATATRMNAEAIEAAAEARRLAEKAGQQ